MKRLVLSLSILALFTTYAQAEEYMLIHEYPNSRDSDFVGRIKSDELICETDDVTVAAVNFLRESWQIGRAERVPGGYGVIVSKDEFWKYIHQDSDFICVKRR